MMVYRVNNQVEYTMTLAAIHKIDTGLPKCSKRDMTVKNSDSDLPASATETDKNHIFPSKRRK